jgi:hypothetical protein
LREKQQALLDAAERIERALQDLDSAYTAYLDAYQDVGHAVGDDMNKGLTLQTSIGHDGLDRLIVQRLRAAGLGPVLEQARTPGLIGDLAAALHPKIRSRVPA